MHFSSRPIETFPRETPSGEAFIAAVNDGRSERLSRFAAMRWNSASFSALSIKEDRFSGIRVPRARRSNHFELHRVPIHGAAISEEKLGGETSAINFNNFIEFAEAIIVVSSASSVTVLLNFAKCFALLMSAGVSF